MYYELCLFIVLGAQCTYSNAYSTCYNIRKPMCPAHTAVERIMVTVNGKKLTAVSQEFSSLYNYAYYYNSSKSIQVKCSVANAIESHVFMCGQSLRDVYAVCAVGETCTLIKTFSYGADYTNRVLYCYTLTGNTYVGNVARLTLHYNNMEHGHGADASTHEADTASGFGLYEYGFYALTVLCALLVTIALIVAIRTFCAHKKKKDHVTIHNRGEPARSDERLVENELYVSSGPQAEYSVPHAGQGAGRGAGRGAGAPRGPAVHLINEPEASRIYMNVHRFNQ